MVTLAARVLVAMVVSTGLVTALTGRLAALSGAHPAVLALVGAALATTLVTFLWPHPAAAPLVLPASSTLVALLLAVVASLSSVLLALLVTRPLALVLACVSSLLLAARLLSPSVPAALLVLRSVGPTAHPRRVAFGTLAFGQLALVPHRVPSAPVVVVLSLAAILSSHE